MPVYQKREPKPPFIVDSKTKQIVTFSTVDTAALSNAATVSTISITTTAVIKSATQPSTSTKSLHGSASFIVSSS